MTEHPVEVDAELHFLTDWESVQDRSKTRKAGIVSIALHVGLIVGLLSLPKSVTAPVTEAIAKHVTPLIAPLTDMTQTAPNRGKVNKEFNVESTAPRPSLRAPATPPPSPVTKAAAPVKRLTPPPIEKKAAPAPAPNLPDAPKVEVAQQAPPQTPPVNMPQVAPPPPQIQQQEKPKLTMENPAPASAVGQGTGKLARPGTGIQEAINAVSRPGASGGLVVGDAAAASPGMSGGINAPPMPGRPGASLELMSNPQGVDFKPFLIQVLAKVKLNWFNIWPQSARMGRQGRVTIQFIIGRDGFVPKLVIASASGTEALDRCAVSAISASQKFPELPSGYQGNEVRLQLNFVYNMR